MLSQTIQVMLRNWTYYVLIVVAALAIFAFDEAKGGTSSNNFMIFIWALLALFVHYAILFDAKFADIGKNNRNFIWTFLPFFLKALALGLLGLVASLPVIFIILANSSASWESGNFLQWPLLLAVLCALVIYALVLTIVGTWLPASVYGVRKSFGDAFRRGKRGFLPAFARLLSSLLLSTFLPLAIIVVGCTALSSATMMIDGRPNIPLIGIMAASLLIEAMGVTYVAVVLSKIYIASENVLSPESGNPPAAVT